MNSRSRGFTLVESLIALLLLSIGLLGAVALLLEGLRTHGEALRHAAATRLVRELADRIRANPLARGMYDTGGAAGSPCDPAASCDPSQRAAADLAYFIATSRQLFPGSETAATIQFEPAIGPAAVDRYTLSLRWRGLRHPAGDPAGDSAAITLHLLARPVAG